jgi:hypothetical protein
MSSEKHPNLQLHKWAPTDYVKREEWNENFGIIDDKIGILEEEKANKTEVDAEFDQRKFNIKKWEHLKVAVAGGWDWSPVLQAAIKYVMERGGGTIWCPDDDYTFYGDVYTHPSNLDMNYKYSPITIEGITPVYADLYNTTKKVTRFIKKQPGTLLGVNFNETTECVIPSVYRNITIKNIAFLVEELMTVNIQMFLLVQWQL